MASSIAISINSLTQEKKDVDTLIKEDIAFEKSFLKLDSAGNDLIVSILQYIVNPTGQGANDTTYQQLKTNFHAIEQEVLTLANLISQKQDLHILNDIKKVIADINSVINMAEGNSSSIGLFRLADQEDTVVNQFDLKIGQLVTSLNAFKDNVTGSSISGTVQNDVLTMGDTALEGESFVLHYLVQYDQQDRQDAVWIFGLDNNTNDVGNAATSFTPLTTMLNKLETDVNGNTSLQNDLTPVVNDLQPAKDEVNNVITHKVNIETESTKLNNLADNISVETNALNQTIAQAIAAEKANVDTNYTHTLRQVTVISVVAIISSLIIAAYISSQTVTPLKELQEDVQKMSSGDLTDSYDENSNDMEMRLVSLPRISLRCTIVFNN